MTEQQHWPPELDVLIDSLAQGGAGVGRWQGRPVFVSGALPGEQVRVRLQERRASWARGVMTALLGPASPQRSAPPCPVYAQCGGCDWQHLALEHQRAGKAHILRDQLAHLGQLADVAVADTAAGAAWHYRSTARLHIRGTQIGFYAAGSRTIVGFDACPLLDTRLNAALAALRTQLPLDGLKAATLRLSTSSGAIHVHLAGHGSAQWTRWGKQLLHAHSAFAGVSSAVGGGWRMLAGDPYLEEELGGVRLRISPTSFFQANVEQARAVLAQLQQRLRLEPSTTLLDAFCGVGTFVLPLAGQVRHAWGIEEHAAAMKDATASAQLAAIDNVQLLTGKVETVLPQLGATPDVVILDPPRRGCEPATLQALLHHQPQQIAYVSCHPGTLARDVGQLVGAGYQVVHAQPFDFFPQTTHIESVVLLERQQLT